LVGCGIALRSAERIARVIHIFLTPCSIPTERHSHNDKFFLSSLSSALSESLNREAIL